MKDNVNGTVLLVSESNVKCEIVLDNQTININLPILMFPKDIKFADPINLRIGYDGSPVIVKREIIKKENDPIISEINGLIQGLA